MMISIFDVPRSRNDLMEAYELENIDSFLYFNTINITSCKVLFFTQCQMSSEVCLPKICISVFSYFSYLFKLNISSLSELHNFKL